MSILIDGCGLEVSFLNLSKWENKKTCLRLSVDRTQKTLLYQVVSETNKLRLPVPSIGQQWEKIITSQKFKISSIIISWRASMDKTKKRACVTFPTQDNGQEPVASPTVDHGVRRCFRVGDGVGRLGPPSRRSNAKVTDASTTRITWSRLLLSSRCT